MSARRVATSILCLVGAAFAHSCTKADVPPSARAIADEYWAAYVDRYPEMATYQGVSNAPQERLTDNSLQALSAWQAREDGWLAALRETHDSSAWLLNATVREALEASIAVRTCRSELWNLSDDSFAAWHQFMTDWMAAQPVGTTEARQAALARWRSLPRFIDTEAANLREGMKLGYSAPRNTVANVIRQLDALLATPARESPLLEPARRDGDSAFARALGQIVGNDLHPALRRFRDFLVNEYSPAARESLGVSVLPNGPACYAASLRAHTTLELDPKTVHDTGLAEMARIEAEMKAIAERSFGTSDVPRLLDRLRSDRRFTFRSRDELIAYATSAVDRARSAMPKWFGVVPAAGLTIQPFPAFREPSADQYNAPADDGSRPGVYLISTWEPTKKSRAGSESAAFHEAIPGHHLQIVIAMERRDLHPVQRFVPYDYPTRRYNGAFQEGWALYAERLADEMGLYSSDLDRLGMLSSQAWRAARLVIDPGIHALGWGRDQAIQYLLSHTTVPRSLAEAEVDRYISYPGQAVGYMIGALEIRRLRAEASRRLGARFDIRQFHDRILEDGALPMHVLGEKVERWVTDYPGGTP